jgi:hypothetical protein
VKGIGSIKIAGDLRGASGQDSGEIYSASDISSVSIGHSLVGSSSGGNSYNIRGQVVALGRISSVTVGQNVVGQGGSYSAAIVGDSIGQVQVRGDIRTGTGFRSGAIIANEGSIDIVKVGGAIRPSDVASAAPFIYADGRIGSITAESIQGSAGFTSEVPAPAQIIAKGLLNPKTAAQAVAIGSVRVLEYMGQTQIIAGQDSTGNLLNVGARIGTVEVGSGTDEGVAWYANDIIAGFAPGFNGTYGGGQDSQLGLTSTFHSSIAKVIVRGGFDDADGYPHAIEAAEIGSIIINGRNIALKKGARNDEMLSLEDDGSTVANEAESFQNPV